MKLSEIGEFGLIKAVSGAFEVPEGVLGIGDDCAVLPQCEGMETLVSTDMLVEGTHFLMEDISPENLGWKSAAVNFSDIAAMGGRPVGTFLSLALPKDLEVEWVQRFIEGYKNLSLSLGAPLLGGDTTSSPDKLCINVTVLGECPKGQSRKRSSALPGDLVCVTGSLGDSAAGLRLILESKERDAVAETLIGRHYHPVPRITEGEVLASVEAVHAMMDISDGIGSDLRHILEASGVGAEIDTARLPLSRELIQVCKRYGWNPFDLAISGGEDYELLFTVSPTAETTLSVPHSVIGRITSGAELKWLGTDRDFSGYRHF